jgi:hypothetical protein
MRFDLTLTLLTTLSLPIDDPNIVGGAIGHVYTMQVLGQHRDLILAEPLSL